MTTFKADPIYWLNDAAVPAHVKAAARRSTKPYTRVMHMPGCWQLLTDDDVEECKRLSRKLMEER